MTLGAAALNLDDIAGRVFIDLVIIVVVARLMGQLMRRIGQPAVIGEIFAGIVLGPTLLGAFPGNLDQQLFPTQVVPYLNIVAQVGLVIFMFIVGLELDLKLIRGKERTAAVVSVSSIALPFGLGFALAAVLFDSHMTVGHTTIDFLPFAVFLGASMSVTAFPVLARIFASAACTAPRSARSRSRARRSTTSSRGRSWRSRSPSSTRVARWTSRGSCSRRSASRR